MPAIGTFRTPHAAPQRGSFRGKSRHYQRQSKPAACDPTRTIRPRFKPALWSFPQHFLMAIDTNLNERPQSWFSTTYTFSRPSPSRWTDVKKFLILPRHIYGPFSPLICLLDSNFGIYRRQMSFRVGALSQFGLTAAISRISN